MELLGRVADRHWREAMVRAVLAPEGGSAGPASFAVNPQGIASGDFSFVVIGDTGEGDASQHVLRDQLLSVANGPDVRFVVLSSDVVYPSGAMRDYEAKFWLPFKGVTRPIYAIPGNHDWYDALEGFDATFLQADAAEPASARGSNPISGVTSTTDGRIEYLIQEAARLRQAYGVPTGFQRAPFFEVQTDRFALIAIDTGVLRKIDAEQERWLDGALQRAAGKMTMAIVGHPFFAGGHDMTAGDAEFIALKQRLLGHGVTIVMGGDTHDLEYYVERDASGHSCAPLRQRRRRCLFEFRHGPELARSTCRPPTGPTIRTVCPSSQKIEANTPWWKRPAWWWTKSFDAWPFSAEWLSAMFDYNVAPFFQSFVEVKVEPSANRVRIVPYGVNGRLTWDEVATSSGVRPGGAPEDAFVEWVIPMTR